jgi:hypothetical protein
MCIFDINDSNIFAKAYSLKNAKAMMDKIRTLPKEVRDYSLIV